MAAAKGVNGIGRPKFDGISTLQQKRKKPSSIDERVGTIGLASWLTVNGRRGHSSEALIWSNGVPAFRPRRPFFFFGQSYAFIPDVRSIFILANSPEEKQFEIPR